MVIAVINVSLEEILRKPLTIAVTIETSITTSQNEQLQQTSDPPRLEPFTLIWNV